jgi:hypothetical protein
MDIKPQTSFIPKKPIMTQQGASHSGGVHINIFMTLAVIIFIASILGAGGVFAWGKVLKQQEIKNAETLRQAREAFDPALIEDLKKVSSRLALSKEVLNKHIAASDLFAIIEELTLQSVRFKNFTFSNSEKEIRVSMSGEAENFTSIALQSDVFGKSKKILEPVISNLSLEQNGNVSFEFSAKIPPSALSYASKVAQTNSIPEAQDQIEETQ